MAPTFELGDAACHRAAVTLIAAAVHEPKFLPALLDELDPDDIRTLVHSFAIGMRVILYKLSVLTGKPVEVFLVEMGLFAAEFGLGSEG